MKSYIITMLDNKKSVESTDKCIKSGKKFGYNNIEIFKATTPKDNLKHEFEKDGLSINDFKVDTRYSKLEPAMCCYLSHKELWKKCLELNDLLIIQKKQLLIELSQFPMQILIKVGIDLYLKQFLKNIFQILIHE